MVRQIKKKVKSPALVGSHNKHVKTNPCKVPFPTYFMSSPGEIQHTRFLRVTEEVDYLNFITPTALTLATLSSYCGISLLRHVTAQHGAPQS